MYMWFWPISSLWLFPLCTAQQVLNHFRNQFIDYMDANAIVHDLKHEDIIGDGDLTTITRTPDARQQNQHLHACLLKKCTEDALRKMCGIIIDVQGNPRMKALGEDMKSMLEGKCCVQVFIHAHCMLSVYLTQSPVFVSLCSLRDGPASMAYWVCDVLRLLLYIQQVHTAFTPSHNIVMYSTSLLLYLYWPDLVNYTC